MFGKFRGSSRECPNVGFYHTQWSTQVRNFFRTLLCLSMCICCLRTQVALTANECDEGDQCLICVEDGMPGSLSPLRPRTITDARVQTLIHDGPFAMSETGVPRASLVPVADDGQPDFNCSQDGMSATGTLKNVLDHNRQKLTVADLESTLKAYAEASRNGAIATRYYEGLVTSVKSTSAMSNWFQVKFKRPLKDCRSAFYLKLLPRSAFPEKLRSTPEMWVDHSGMMRKPIGYGPYRIAGSGLSTQQSYLDLDRFSEYHKGTPKIPHIRILGTTPPTETVEMLRIDQVQMVVSLNKKYQKLARDAGARTVPYSIRNWWYISFNHQQELLKKLEMRKAIALITNRYELAQQIADNIRDASQDAPKQGYQVARGDELSTGEPELELISGPFVPDSGYYNEGVKPFGADMSKGRDTEKRLIEALSLLKTIPGLEFNQSLRRWFYQGKKVTFRIAVKKEMNGGEDVAIVFKQQLEDAGFSASILPMAQSEWDLRAGDMELAIGRWNFDHHDEIRPIFSSSGTLNFHHYRNKEVDDLFAQFSQAPDIGQQYKAMKDVHEILAKDLAMIFLWTVDQVAAFHRRVKNYKVHSFTFYVNPHSWELSPRISRTP